VKAGRSPLVGVHQTDARSAQLPAPGLRPADRTVRVLLVEDSPDAAWAIQHHLERGGFKPHILRVHDDAGVAAALEAGSWDVVIASTALPSMTGLDVVRRVRAVDAELPCLLVAGTVQDASVIEAVRQGACDYVCRDNLTRLVPATERELRTVRSRKQHRQAEQALAGSEERVRLVLEQALDAIVMFTSDGRITEWNGQAALLFGLSRSEAIGRVFGEVVLAPRWRVPFASALQEAFQRAGSLFCLRRRTEVNGQRQEGSLLSMEVTLIPVPSSTGLSFCAFVRDLSERKAADAKRASLEHQLRQSQKMEAVGKLAGGIAHDFNNLLTVIQGQASLLEAGLLGPEESPGAVSAIVDASDRAAQLTRQLLAFSRQQVVRLTPVDLNELVVEVSKLLRRLIGADVELHTQLSPGVVGIEADTSMIEQVLMNLAVNARDAMPHGGSLVVSTSVVLATPPAAAVAAGSGPGPFARLSVRDTGCGISPQTLPHIFEPFFTTKDRARSTGLGLATVFGIVEQHRGWVEVVSHPGDGAAFHVFLPQRATSKAAPGATPRVPALPRGTECILVVEDEASVREMVRDVLARQGFRVIEAGSGQEALDVWARDGAGVDMVVSDIVMPDGMSGPELVARLREERPSLKAVFTSGYSTESDRVSMEMRTGVNFVQKPFRPAALIHIIRERLDDPA
jgi:two-component system, cell cycle sensor histidine kinase and response regulator CckA